MKTRTYRIVNRSTGTDLGLYRGATKEQALDAMAMDAGYHSYADVLHQGLGALDDLLVTDETYLGRMDADLLSAQEHNGLDNSELIREWCNADLVMLEPDGRCWIEQPGAGRWLDQVACDDFAKWCEAGYHARG